MALPESAVGMSVAEEADIDAYFERIGFAGSIAPSLETLSLLHQMHPAAIPFENLSPLMGVPVRLELANLQQKLLFERRGGFCIEHNLLFKAVLEALDFPVRAYAAEVLWGRGEGGEETAPAAPSHMLLVAEVNGANYLCDVGFGALTLTAPLRLRADTEQATPHETVRLVGGDPVWRLEAQLRGEWRALYRFEASPVDFEGLLEMSERASRTPLFRDNLCAARAERSRRLTLRNLVFRTRPVDGEPEERTLSGTAELREVLSGPFGIELPTDERLQAALERIAMPQPPSAADET
jgi:N-hydroxyarylamine O-acetyltransferase